MLPILTIANGSTAKSWRFPLHGYPNAAPRQVSLQEREPAELLELGGASEPVLDRVNQSHLTTIDPLLAVEA